jgi:hypothetical protein
MAQTNLIPQLATVIEERAKLFQFDASCSAVT